MSTNSIIGTAATRDNVNEHLARLGDLQHDIASAAASALCLIQLAQAEGDDSIAGGDFKVLANEVTRIADLLLQTGREVSWLGQNALT